MGHPSVGFETKLVSQEEPDGYSSWLTQQFRTAYTAFDRQDLSDRKFVYIWADGIYLKAGLGTEKACRRVRVGADTEGQKHLLAWREGYRESAKSWGALWKDCRQRGRHEPACWIADGALGLWAAVNEQSRSSAQQRCTNHKTMNVIDKLPKAERPEATPRLRASMTRHWFQTRGANRMVGLGRRTPELSRAAKRRRLEWVARHG